MQENQTQKLEYFTNGQHVEVTSKDEGFKGAWYKATIQESPSFSFSSRKQREAALIEYHNLLSTDGSKPLTQIMDLRCIRPLPPSHDTKESSFEENDVVDAFYNYGWWTGVVCRVLDRNKFWVYYNHPHRDVVEVESKDLRPHWEWIHGKWILAEKRKNTTGSSFQAGNAVEIRSDEESLGDVWFPATVLGERKGRFVVKYNTKPNDDKAVFSKTIVDKLHIRHVPHSSSGRGFDLLDKVQVAGDSGWTSGLITRVLPERRYEVVLKLTNETKQVCHSDLRTCQERIDGIWVTKNKKSTIAPTNQDQVEEKKNGANIPNLDLRVGSTCTIRDITRQRTPHSSMTNSRVEQPNDHSDLSASYASTPRDRKAKLSAMQSIYITSQLNKRFIRGKSSKRPLDTFSKDSLNISAPNTRNTGVKRSRKSGVGNILSIKYESPSDGKKDDEHEAGRSGTTISLIKSGRPPKSAVKMPISKGGMVACANNGVTGAESGNPDILISNDNVMMGSLPTKEKNWDDTAVEKSVEARKQKGEKNSHKRKRGRPCKLDISSLTFLNAGEKALDLCGTVTKTREETLLGQAVEQHVETVTRKADPQSANSTGGNVSNDVPFLKCSPLWKIFETMDIFKSLPHKPHFRPLSECKEECREGYAIGMMVTYSSIAEKVPKLKFDDPRSSFANILEGLLEVENHGFDVIALRGHVNDLLRLKDRESELQDEIKDVEAKMSQLTHEVKESDTAIDEIEKEIASLQQKLLQVKSRKENASITLGKLQSHQETIKANIQLEIGKLARSGFKTPMLES